MRTALITLILILSLSATLEAATGYLIDQWVKGNKKYCVYDVLGDEHIVTIASYKICPTSVRV